MAKSLLSFFHCHVYYLIEDLNKNVKTPTLDELSAIARLKQGDLAGMEFLVSCYQVQAVSAAYLIVRDLNSAEDIVQNSFLQAAQKIDQFDEEKLFGPWFLRSVVNASLRAASREKRQVSLEKDLDEETAKVAAWLLDPEACPDEIVETAEMRQMVWNALEQLTPEQRAVIIMRHFLEMNLAEITGEVDRPATTVRWWLRTARNRLIEILQPFWQQEHPEWMEERQEHKHE